MRGPETQKSHIFRKNNGFYDKYLQGKGIDVGYRGHLRKAATVVDGAIGVDLDYPGYDGITLPFGDESLDFVFNSHCLEHIADPYAAIRDWFRVLKVGGYLVIMVPHQYLYECKKDLPSNWNRDHKRFYTAGVLLTEIDLSLEPNTWRLRHCIDNDRDYDYEIGHTAHPQGCYEIECVIQKLEKPEWELK